MSTRLVAAIRVALAATILLLPVVVYVWQFGWSLSNNHARWAEFGSAMAGIYTPILALATLGILVMQVQLQGRMHKHEIDQAFIQQARSDIEFYAVRLATLLNERATQVDTLGEFICAEFQLSAAAQLDDERLRVLARDINRQFPQLLALEQAVQAILAGLSATTAGQFQAAYMASIQKLIAMLGFGACVALEHYERTFSEGRGVQSYHFSPCLTSGEP